MKQHRLSFKGVEQDTVIAAHKRTAELKQHLPQPLGKDYLLALFDTLTIASGDAIEEQMLSLEEMRELFNEMRIVVWRRKTRPKLTTLQDTVLRAIGRHDTGVDVGKLAEELSMSRTAVTSVVHASVSKGLLHREIRQNKGLFTLTDAAAGFKTAPPVNRPGALIVNPRVASMKPLSTPHGPRLK